MKKHMIILVFASLALGGTQPVLAYDFHLPVAAVKPSWIINDTSDSPKMVRDRTRLFGADPSYLVREDEIFNKNRQGVQKFMAASSYLKLRDETPYFFIAPIYGHWNVGVFYKMKF